MDLDPKYTSPDKGTERVLQLLKIRIAVNHTLDH